MSPEEVVAFLGEERTVACATVGPRGWPHVMPLWYTVRDGDVYAWTYAKSQKVRNLERDPRATLQIEAGDRYDLLRGVMIEADVVIHHDLDVIRDFGRELFERYTGGFSDEIIEAQAPKRVVLQFVAQRVSSFDHRKLEAGVY